MNKSKRTTEDVLGESEDFVREHTETILGERFALLPNEKHFHVHKLNNKTGKLGKRLRCENSLEAARQYASQYAAGTQRIRANLVSNTCFC